MKRKEYAARYALYIAGLYILGFSLALIIRSALGTSPISSWAYVMSSNTPLTVGTYTFIINVAMIFIPNKSSRFSDKCFIFAASLSGSKII